LALGARACHQSQKRLSSERRCALIECYPPPRPLVGQPFHKHGQRVRANVMDGGGCIRPRSVVLIRDKPLAQRPPLIRGLGLAGREESPQKEYRSCKDQDQHGFSLPCHNRIMSGQHLPSTKNRALVE
jgi:hypothetical protein